MPEDAVQIRRCTTFSELTEEVARAEVAAVSRFHNLIAALRVGRPTVSLGYAPKSRHLMQTMGLGGYCLDLVDLDASSLVSLVSRARAHRQQLTRVISATSTASAADVERLLKDVGEFVMGAAVVTPASSAREWAS
jgi:polysaccharide pyruvyl transferase WcaK-like protein